jgi:general secretion pathway protein E
MLIERGKIDAEDLERALELQRERGDKLGKIWWIWASSPSATCWRRFPISWHAAGDGGWAAAFGARNRRPFAPLPAAVPAFPVALADSTLTVAMADPLDFETIAAVRAFSGLEIQTVLAAEQEILDAIEKHYGEGERHALLGEGDDEQAMADLEHLRDMASEAPVIRLVNAMIAEAIESAPATFTSSRSRRNSASASAWMACSQPGTAAARAEGRHHFAPQADGQAQHRRAPPAAGRPHQDQDPGPRSGSARFHLPTLYGESVVMRLLDRSAGDFYDLRRLGFDDRMLERMEHFTSLPHGIFLVTGPTGSGKSTTLYSALKRINLPDKKIITIEDPVEYQMDGINQIHVNPQIGLTFAAGLRHIVRQDPDVIMVGEIRDRETADIAIRAALTGHLVFSTLHTNDAPSAITRLTDMGVENYLITSSLVAVLAQRLVRVICPHCKQPAGRGPLARRRNASRPSAAPAARVQRHRLQRRAWAFSR